MKKPRFDFFLFFIPFFTVLPQLILLNCCPRSTFGTIAGAQSDTGFIKETDYLYFFSDKGFSTIRLNGSDYRLIFSGYYYQTTPSPDRARYAMQDSATNLFIGNPETGGVFEIKELRNRCGHFAFSKDSKRLAASRHAAYSTRQSQWSKTESNEVYIINVATYQVSHIPASRLAYVSRLAWSKDGQALFFELGHKVFEKLDLETHRRSVINEWPKTEIGPFGGGQAVSQCPSAEMQLTLRGFRGDLGMDLLRPGKKPEQLVRIEGRKRGFGDHQSNTIRGYNLSPSCRYAVYTFQRNIWVVEIESRKTAPITLGRDPIWF